MALESGQMLLHYRLGEKIGEGGMGVVWKATDTTLGREVAVKVLPDLFSEDPERLVRFEREAKLLASLNHPGIASIYGFHEAEGNRFLAMELVPGKDLFERIGRGALPVEEALDIGRQMAEALEAAHESGVVHRDLKPANVKISPDGTVKILDFGLAKALEPETDAVDASLSPTITQKATRAGVIMGTAAYMSPEQARGRPIDRRADIWAFGVILFEMLTGRRLFPGETISDIIAAVLRADPDWAALPPATPHPIRELLRRCLTRDRKARQRDIGDARIAIQETLAGESEELSIGDRPADRPRRRAPVILWITGVLAVAIAAAVVSRLLVPHPIQAVVKMEILAEVDIFSQRSFMISPDGRALVFASEDGLWVRRMDDVNPSALAGTEGASDPFWSPDGRQIGYFSGERLWRIGADGGSAILVCRLPGPVSGAAWRGDNTIVFSQARGPLFKVSAQGGDPEVLLALSGDDVDFHQPWPLPDGKSILFSVHRTAGVDRIVLFDGVERKILLEVKPDSNLTVQVLNTPTYSPTGHLVYRRDQGNTGVWAVPLDLSEREIRGAPFLVAQGGHAPSVSETGVLSYAATKEGGPVQMTWLDRTGKLLEAVGEPFTGARGVTLSPEGRRAAVVLLEGGNQDIWVINLEDGSRTRLTFTPEDEAEPAWSPDGRWIVYSCAAGAEAGGLCRRAADGSGDREVLAPLGKRPVFEPGGEALIYLTRGGSRRGVMRLELDGGKEPEMVHETTPWAVWDVAVSPDGRYVAYGGDDGGRIGVRIVPLDGREGKWEVGGASLPTWSASGRELFYWDNSENVLVAVPVETEPVVTLGRPERLFKLDASGAWVSLSVSADSKRFLVVQPAERASGPSGIIVIHNWYSEFRDDLP